MESNKKNIQAICEAWTPVIKNLLGESANSFSPEKMAWMCELAHNQRTYALNEAADAVGGVSLPLSNLNNTLGIGNAVPPQIAAATAAEETGRANIGSGDKWPVTLPIAMQVAGRTIGFDLVNVHTLEGPTGVLPFVDYVYSDSKLPYGATPSYNEETANPKKGSKGDKPWRSYSMPSLFEAKVAVDSSVAISKLKIGYGLRKAGVFKIENELSGAWAKIDFVDMGRLHSVPEFRVVESEGSLGQLFEGTSAQEPLTVEGTFETKDGVEFTIGLYEPDLVSMLENQIQGYTGSGRYDSDRWSGTFQDPFHLFEPMDRATGETHMPRHLSLKVFTKYFEVDKIDVAVSVTREQITDLQRQWGIDVLKMVENAAINELSQTINKHILSRLFAMGWRNHMEAYESEGVNLNISLGESTKIGFATYKDGAEVKPEDAEMTVPAMHNYGDYENMDTKFSRVAKLIMTASNVITQRGRRGPATYVVANYKIASLLQANAQYTFTPIANTFSQEGGQIYPLGNLAGMTVYVDPFMRWDDTRVLVGRKGQKDEPGLYFCPYLMAESINFISPATMAPQVVVQSRYRLVEVGWWPQTQVITLFVNTPENIY